MGNTAIKYKYLPENIKVLETHLLQTQIQDPNDKNKPAILLLFKLYQFFPTRADPEIAALALGKLLIMPEEEQDTNIGDAFTHAKYILHTSIVPLLITYFSLPLFYNLYSYFLYQKFTA